MKRIFTTCVLVFSFSIFAQEAGKAGELLKNEASKTEMQTPRKDVLGRSGTGNSTTTSSGNILDNSNYRKPTQSSGTTTTTSSSSTQKTNLPNYQWNQSLGYSEVFLRIPENGYFTVEIGDQMMSNASGKFRFFDLSAGKMPIAIYQNGYLVYRTNLNVRNNSRMVLDFFTNYGLYLLDSYTVQGNTYGFNQWDDLWNNPYGMSTMSVANYGGNVMDPYTFSGFMRTLQGFSFDSRKNEFVQSQLKNMDFTAEQIRIIVQEFDFDSGRLNVAKALYQKCIDKQNYFVVYDAFDFYKNKKELIDFVTNV